MQRVFPFLLAAALGSPALVFAENRAPWGSADVLAITYTPQKVLYDLDKGSPEELANILDRVGYLYQVTGSNPVETSIVVVIHGDAIPMFAIAQWQQYKALMQRAQSLTVGTPIEFRMCQAAARMQNYQAGDIHGFVKMIPMADAEIVRLQQAGYAYMR